MRKKDAPRSRAVECQCRGEGQDQHDRHLHDEEQHDAAERLPELRVGEGAHVVVEPDERGAADQLLLEEAEVQRIGERCEEHQGEHDHERADEGPSLPVAFFTPADAVVRQGCGVLSRHRREPS